MTNPTQIGTGNRAVDRFMLYFQGVLLVLLLTASLFNINWLIGAGIFFVILAFYRGRTMRRYYVYIHGDHFVVKHVLKPDVAINKDQYLGISKPWSSGAFSTELTISFKDGRNFEFIAGDSRTSEVDKAIKQTIHPANS